MDPEGWLAAIIQPDAEAGLVRPHAHVSDDAAAAAPAPGSAAVPVDAERLDLDAEFHLGELDRIVFLGDVIDRVDAVGEGASAETDRESLDA